MRGKDYNTGLRGVLFEARHYERMGAAVWLYGWLVLRQTRQEGATGWVLGGARISYQEIEEETGFNRRTLERWMQVLRQGGYIETESSGGGISVRITKAKKFPHFPQRGRRNAEGGREIAERPPQNCVASDGNPQWDQQVPGGIGSSSIERYKEEEKPQDFHRHFHKPPNSRSKSFHRCKNHNSKSQHLQTQRLENPSCLDHDKNQRHNNCESNQQSREHSEERHTFDTNNQSSEQYISPRQFFAEARLRLQLLRAEREEAVRRELHVGTGPAG
jgi:hypothetical protein